MVLPPPELPTKAMVSPIFIFRLMWSSTVLPLTYEKQTSLYSMQSFGVGSNFGASQLTISGVRSKTPNTRSIAINAIWTLLKLLPILFIGLYSIISAAIKETKLPAVIWCVTIRYDPSQITAAMPNDTIKCINGDNIPVR